MEENLKIVKSVYALADPNGSLISAFHLFDPEVEYVNPDGAMEPGTRRGLEAFREAVEKVAEAWEFWRMEPEELTAVGDDRVAVVVSYTARGRESGVDIHGRESALWTLRDGKVVRYQWFLNPRDALEAAGLPGEDRRGSAA
jgi:ketosteroid isomerase-like protein